MAERGETLTREEREMVERQLREWADQGFHHVVGVEPAADLNPAPQKDGSKNPRS